MPATSRVHTRSASRKAASHLRKSRRCAPQNTLGEQTVGPRAQHGTCLVPTQCTPNPAEAWINKSARHGKRQVRGPESNRIRAPRCTSFHCIRWSEVPRITVHVRTCLRPNPTLRPARSVCLPEVRGKSFFRHRLEHFSTGVVCIDCRVLSGLPLCRHGLGGAEETTEKEYRAA